MRERNLYNSRRALPRMSWSPRNLFNLWRRSLTDMKELTNFTSSNKSLFQQRWMAKQLTRGYHGDHVPEKIFKRWYLPSTLPDVRPHAAGRTPGSSHSDDREALSRWALRAKTVAKERAVQKDEERLAQAPVASLMFEETERRIDVFIFRCCFAHSVYEARRMVIHGSVLLNGKKHTNANTRLAPGDMVSVDPSAIRFLHEPLKTPTGEEAEETSEEQIEAAAMSSSSDSNSEASASEPPLESSAEPAPLSSDSPSSSKRASSPTSRKSSKDKSLAPFYLPPYAAPFLFIPAYIEVSFETCSAIFVRRPTARYNYSEIPSPYEADGEVMRLTWEWYNLVRPRMRSKKQLARMPDNRKETRVIPGIRDKRRDMLEITGSSLAAQMAKNSIY